MAHPVTLPDPAWICFLWEESLPISLTTELLLENQKLLRFLGQSTILCGDQGPDRFSSCLPALPTTQSLQVPSPDKQEGWDWEGCQAVFSPVGQRVFPGCLKGVRGLEEGGGVEWPPSFSPDQGEEMQVH